MTFENREEISSEDDEIPKFCTGAGGNTNDAGNVVMWSTVGSGAGVGLEQSHSK